MDVPLIEFKEVTKRFGPRTILDHVNLQIYEGQITTIIGLSGAGKSVLLKHIIGLIESDSGQILFVGQPMAQMKRMQRKALKKRFSYLFQGAALFDSLTVWENVAFRLLYSEGGKRAASKEKAIDCLTQVGLAPEVGALRPSELSGGMQKRVSLARAIASNPEILFFDEPTTGLDPIMSDVINNLIVDRVKAIGATAISITHDMASARKIADEVAMLYQGVIIWRGKPDDLENSDNPMVDQFVNGRADGPIQMQVRKFGKR